MKTTTKLSLVAIIVVSLFAGMSGNAQAKHRHIFACPGKPGTLAALLCPAKK
ncbi:hypothetical protein [Methyloceanibacter sp.]|uniref:hypothetical protein n=1 Tax=Methyloceanibacter sp. TaxID=1965321 RepID=UPI002D4C4BF4|nr:hypothetical protein [Methyloceanibacter sp.]HZP09326.1 hypothetical protein [Methyloceanibacter sp.]